MMYFSELRMCVVNIIMDLRKTHLNIEYISKAKAPFMIYLSIIVTCTMNIIVNPGITHLDTKDLFQKNVLMMIFSEGLTCIVNIIMDPVNSIGSAIEHVLYFKCHRNFFNGIATQNTDLGIFCDTCLQ